VEINRIELLSIGIDVGSSTSQSWIFSKLILVRDEEISTLKFRSKKEGGAL